MSSLLDRRTNLQNVEQNIRQRIKQNQCQISCFLPFSSQSGFASSSTVGTDSSGGKSVSGGSGASAMDTIDLITVNAVNGCFENLKATQFTTENASMSTALIQQASIAQINGNINFNGSNMTNVNIDSGTIDNTIIGGSVPVDGTFTDLQANETFTLLGASGNDCVTYSAETETFTICGKLVVGGSTGGSVGQIDNTIVGGITPSLGTFTNLTITNDFTILGPTGNDCITYSAETQTFTICGDLIVEGNQTILQTETIVVDDVTIRLGNTSIINDDKDRGIEFGYKNGITSSLEMGFMGWDNSENKFTFLLNASKNNEVYNGNLAGVLMDTLCVNNIKGITGDLNINPDTNIILNPQENILIPSNKYLFFGTSSVIYNSDDDLILQSANDIILNISGSLNVPIDKPIEFGTSQSIYGTGNDLVIQSSNDIILNISGSLNVPINKPIEFGSAEYSIYSNTNDLLLSSGGFIVFDTSCLSLGTELDCMICKDNGNLQFINNSLNGSIEISSQNILLNALNSVKIPDSIPIEFGDFTDIKNDQNNLILSAISGNIIFDTSCLGLGNNFICKDNNGSLTIDVENSVKILNDKPIEFGSSGYSIYSNNIDLILTSNGDIVFDTPCIRFDTTSICELNNQLILNGLSGILLNSENIEIPILKEYRHISYKEFDIDGNICQVMSTREDVGGFPLWYWLTDQMESGTIYYAYDLSQNIRNNNLKGLKLTGIYFWFDILGDSINSVTSSVTKSIMNPLSPGIPILSGLTVNNTLLNTNTMIGNYYTKVDVTMNDYYNSHENLTIEFAINKKTNSIIKFYGMRLEFDKKMF
jgi:hypothetical protein